MLGLFGTLDLANRSLQTQRQGTEIAGQNLANVNNPAYARQRISIQTSDALPSSIGPSGTGADVIAIQQLRDHLLDSQIDSEISARSSLEAQQSALEVTQASLGQQVDRQASGPEGAAAAGGAGGQHGMAENLSNFFNSLQSLSTNPTSLPERQGVLIAAQNLATQFNQISGRLQNLDHSLNLSIESDVASANKTLGQIAQLNDQITAAELGGKGQANDLRDLRQQQLEELAKHIKFDAGAEPNGAVHLSVNGVDLVSGSKQVASLETFDSGNGRLLVRARGGNTALSLAGGSIHGAIEARDGALANVKSDLDGLAHSLIQQVNSVHRTGFSLTGSTNADFFSGTDAAGIQVNSDLAKNPALLQASGSPDAVGDNKTILALAQLAGQKQSDLQNQTFQENYAASVTSLGQSLASANGQLSNQKIVEKMLAQQRDSISGVSIDEEMTDLIKYQKAFEASARLVVTVDQMLDTVVNLKR